MSDEEPPAKQIKLDTEATNISHQYESNKITNEANVRASGGSKILQDDVNSFELLDEVHADENNDINENNYDSYESDIPEDEIDALLEEGLPEEMKRPKKSVTKKDESQENEKTETAPEETEHKFIEIEKTVLVDKDIGTAEMLPEGWISIHHSSGMPIYLHRPTRVCTMARPYFLGNGSTRLHEIPLCAIPCLKYRKDLERENKEMEESSMENPEEKEHDTIKDKENEDSQEIKENGKSKENVENIKSGQDSMENIQNSKPTGTDDENSAHPQLPSEPMDTTTTEDTVLKCPFNGEKDKVKEMEKESTPAPVRTWSDLANNQTSNPLAAALVAQNAVQMPPEVTDIKNLKSNIKTMIYDLKNENLSIEELHNYCKKLFQFKKIKVRRFKDLIEQRKYYAALRKRNRPKLHDGSKVLMFKDMGKGEVAVFCKEWIMNPKNKSYLCILHQYVHHVMNVKPTYEYKEIENAATPYAATIRIGDVYYGTGFGKSKKLAKLEAAKATLAILLPEVGALMKQEEAQQEIDDGKDLAFFDDIKIEDPRVPALSVKASDLTPHGILLNCLQRNYGLAGSDVFGLTSENIESKLVTKKGRLNVFIMTLGKHTVEVPCKKKSDGKQSACQAMLQKLHPHINNWGSLLRLYGNKAMETVRMKKLAEQEITLLQSNATANKPNTSIINKLKEEMLKLQERKSAMRPIGNFTLPENTSLPPSGTDLNNLDL